jgi:serine/threonine protein kinase
VITRCDAIEIASQPIRAWERVLDLAPCALAKPCLQVSWMGVDAEFQAQGAPRVDSALPRAFGKYLLFDRIGRGGMADIFLARMSTELGAGRRVVVKEILPEFSADAGFTQAFVSEAKLAAQLSHNNIVRVLDLGRESGRLYIAMEYVEGFDLNHLLAQLSKRRIPLPAEFALFIVREVLAALDYAHRATDAQGAPLGIVDRDISPSNVLISFEGEVRLGDFGIARAFSAESTQPTSFSGTNDPNDSRIQRVRLVGKSAYMAPEHARGAEVDARSDVFAAGILLWELCAGHRLYKGSEQEMLDQARSAAIPTLPDRGLPDAPRLRGVLERALAQDPAVRYQSAHQMLAALENYALSAQLMASQLRFASFLSGNFSDAIVNLRRERERAAEAALHTLSTGRNEPVVSPVPAALHTAPRTKLRPLAIVQSKVEFADLGSLRPSLSRTLAIGAGAVLLLVLLALWLAH